LNYLVKNIALLYYPFINIFSISDMIINVLDWPMKVLIDLRVIAAGDSFCNNVVKCMGT
jgi:hypothetical protein